MVARLSTEITKVLKAPDVKDRLVGELDTTGPAPFAAVIKADHEKWAGIVKEAGIKK